MSRLHAIGRFARSILSGLGDWLLPEFCVLCGPLADAGDLPNLCDACAARARLYPPGEYCRVCGAPLSGRDVLGTGRCIGCSVRRPPYRALFAAAPYDGLVRELLATLKYGKNVAAAAPLLRIFRSALEARSEGLRTFAADRIVPMPITPSRRAERGFNQTELILDGAADVLGAAIDARALLRRDGFGRQVGRSRAARAEISADAFVAEGVFGRRIALFDDVMTTGATVRAASRALQRAGALEVAVYVLARAE